MSFDAAVEEARFGALRDSWQHLQKEVKSARLGRWRETFKLMQRQQEKLRKVGGWRTGPTDLLRIIQHGRWETSHCHMLAWFMDPYGHHGFGYRFLHRTLAQCSPAIAHTEAELVGVSVEVEVARKDSRADIVVFGRGLTILFEAKVDAEEGPHQCERLYCDFCSDPSPRFVFLTPTGHPPKTATGEAHGRYSTLSFRAIREVLRTLHDEVGCEHPRPRGLTAVSTYLDTLDAEF